MVYERFTAAIRGEGWLIPILPAARQRLPDRAEQFLAEAGLSRPVQGHTDPGAAFFFPAAAGAFVRESVMTQTVPAVAVRPSRIRLGRSVAGGVPMPSTSLVSKGARTPIILMDLSYCSEILCLKSSQRLAPLLPPDMRQQGRQIICC